MSKAKHLIQQVNRTVITFANNIKKVYLISPYQSVCTPKKLFTLTLRYLSPTQ